MLSFSDGRATHVHPTTGKTSAPDTSFAHSSLAERISWDVLNDMRSDHQPIVITYEDDIAKPIEKVRYKWRIEQAKWEEYEKELESKIPQRYNHMNVNKLEKKLSKMITETAQTHIGKKRITKKSKCWMTEPIKEAIKQRNDLKKQARGAWNMHREEWINACRKVADMIREEKSRRWKEYVDTLDAQTDCRQVWNTIRNMDGRRGDTASNEVLEVEGKAYVENKDKADQFAKTYQSFAKLPVEKKDRDFRRKVRKQMEEDEQIGNPIEETEKDIEMHELERAIDGCKNSKAAGEDEIPYEFLKHMGPKAKKFLLLIYNKVWKGKELPKEWRKAIIKPQLKEGKDPR